MDNLESYRKDHSGPCRWSPYPKSIESLLCGNRECSQVHTSEKCKDIWKVTQWKYTDEISMMTLKWAG